MMVLTILHHTLSVSMVIPMNNSYIELDDYRFICFSLLRRGRGRRTSHLLTNN